MTNRKGNDMDLTSTETLMVVETDDELLLGTVEVNGDEVTIRNGLPGRPKIVSRHDIESAVPAERHPDVVLT